MVVKALKPAAELNPLYRWFLIVVLGIYVPGRSMRTAISNPRSFANFSLGSYILYTHMIAQRKKALKKRTE
jgi:very-long-chain (3R)-3-hydroxyacyl-CoA dehydratase